MSAEKTLNKGETVVTGLKDNPNFEAIKDLVTELDVRCTTLSGTIISQNMRNHTSNVAMMNAKADVLTQLDLVRTKADEICNGNENLERETGFTLSKRGRTTRRFVNAAHITAAKPTGVKGQLEITIAEAVEGNQGFEVHYVLEARDYIAGVVKVKGRDLKMLATGLPSLKELEAYLITLSTNQVRSLPSNSIVAAAL